jgi:hypothetical protein
VNHYEWFRPQGFDEHDFFLEYAKAEDHQQFAFYPIRMHWKDPKELVFDFLTTELLITSSIDSFNKFKNTMTHVALACDCHPKFDYYCIMEFARNPEPKYSIDPKLNEDLFYEIADLPVPTYHSLMDPYCLNVNWDEPDDCFQPDVFNSNSNNFFEGLYQPGGINDHF